MPDRAVQSLVELMQVFVVASLMLVMSRPGWR
jgi:hypothetical protein